MEMEIEDLDIYNDLDDFHESEKKKSKELLEFEAKYKESLESIEDLKAENKDLKKKIKTLELNFQSLLDTAKAEIKRKDQQIAQIRKEKDDICFRRKNVFTQRSQQDIELVEEQYKAQCNNPFRYNRDTSAYCFNKYDESAPEANAEHAEAAFSNNSYQRNNDRLSEHTSDSHGSNIDTGRHLLQRKQSASQNEQSQKDFSKHSNTRHKERLHEHKDDNHASTSDEGHRQFDNKSDRNRKSDVKSQHSSTRNKERHSEHKDDYRASHSDDRHRQHSRGFDERSVGNHKSHRNNEASSSKVSSNSPRDTHSDGRNRKYTSQSREIKENFDVNNKESLEQNSKENCKGKHYDDNKNARPSASEKIVNELSKKESKDEKVLHHKSAHNMDIDCEKTMVETCREAKKVSDKAHVQQSAVAVPECKDVNESAANLLQEKTDENCNFAAIPILNTPKRLELYNTLFGPSPKDARSKNAASDLLTNVIQILNDNDTSSSTITSYNEGEGKEVGVGSVTTNDSNEENVTEKNVGSCSFQPAPIKTLEVENIAGTFFGKLTGQTIPGLGDFEPNMLTTNSTIFSNEMLFFNKTKETMQVVERDLEFGDKMEQVFIENKAVNTTKASKNNKLLNDEEQNDKASTAEKFAQNKKNVLNAGHVEENENVCKEIKERNSPKKHMTVMSDTEETCNVTTVGRKEEGKILHGKLRFNEGNSKNDGLSLDGELDTLMENNSSNKVDQSSEEIVRFIENPSAQPKIKNDIVASLHVILEDNKKKDTSIDVDGKLNESAVDLFLLEPKMFATNKLNNESYKNVENMELHSTIINNAGEKNVSEQAQMRIRADEEKVTYEDAIEREKNTGIENYDDADVSIVLLVSDAEEEAEDTGPAKASLLQAKALEGEDCVKTSALVEEKNKNNKTQIEILENICLTTKYKLPAEGKQFEERSSSSLKLNKSTQRTEITNLNQINANKASTSTTATVGIKIVPGSSLYTIDITDENEEEEDSTTTEEDIEGMEETDVEPNKIMNVTESKSSSNADNAEKVNDNEQEMKLQTAATKITATSIVVESDNLEYKNNTNTTIDITEDNLYEDIEMGELVNVSAKSEELADAEVENILNAQENIKKVDKVGKVKKGASVQTDSMDANNDGLQIATNLNQQQKAKKKSAAEEANLTKISNEDILLRNHRTVIAIKKTQNIFKQHEQGEDGLSKPGATIAQTENNLKANVDENSAADAKWQSDASRIDPCATKREESKRLNADIQAGINKSCEKINNKSCEEQIEADKYAELTTEPEEDKIAPKANLIKAQSTNEIAEDKAEILKNKSSEEKSPHLDTNKNNKPITAASGSNSNVGSVSPTHEIAMRQLRELENSSDSSRRTNINSKERHEAQNTPSNNSQLRKVRKEDGLKHQEKLKSKSPCKSFIKIDLMKSKQKKHKINERQEIKDKADDSECGEKQSTQESTIKCGSKIKQEPAKSCDEKTEHKFSQKPPTKKLENKSPPQKSVLETLHAEKENEMVKKEQQRLKANKENAASGDVTVKQISEIHKHNKMSTKKSPTLSAACRKQAQKTETKQKNTKRRILRINSDESCDTDVEVKKGESTIITAAAVAQTPKATPRRAAKRKHTNLHKQLNYETEESECRSSDDNGADVVNKCKKTKLNENETKAVLASPSSSFILPAATAAAIFDTETSDKDVSTLLPHIATNTSQDAQYNEIDSRLQSMFQSPPYKNSASLPQHMNLSTSTPFDTRAYNRTSDLTEVTIEETIDASNVEQSSFTMHDSSSISNNSMETKHLSMGGKDYRFEKISENVVNLFITRKRSSKNKKT